jgi:hypothetical protein
MPLTLVEDLGSILEVEQEISVLQNICQSPAIPETKKLEHGDRLSNLFQLADRHQRIISPIRRLPAEILSEIFLRMDLEANLEKRDFLINRQEIVNVPHLLAQICHFWRNVAISIPYLWVNVPHIQVAKKKTTSHQLAILHLHLERSKGFPLNVSIRADVYSFPRFAKLSDPGLDLIVAHCERWGSLSVFLTPPFVKYLCERKIKHRLFSLASLRIYLTGGVRVEDTDIFLYAQSLRHLILSLHSTHVHSLKFPWETIERFSGY